MEKVVKVKKAESANTLSPSGGGVGGGRKLEIRVNY